VAADEAQAASPRDFHSADRTIPQTERVGKGDTVEPHSGETRHST